MFGWHSKTPFGVNAAPAKWTEEINDTSTRTQSSPAASTYYNPGSLSLAIPIGIWIVEFESNGFFAQSSGTAGQVITAASTANNSLSDQDYYSAYNINPQTGTAAGRSSFYRRKALVLTNKTTYYAVIATNQNNCSSVQFEPNTIIRAIFAAL